GPPHVPPPIVEEQVGNEHVAIVSLEPEPRRDVRILTHRRPTARAAIAVGGAQLTDGAAGVHPPAVGQLHMNIRVRRALLREAPSRPVLPPVEIPIGALVDTRRVIEAQSEPVAPALLVRPLQEPQVVDLEPRRAAQVTGLEVGVLAGDLAEAEFLGVTGEAGARCCVWGPRIGP